eukprot:UN27420
MLRSKFSFMFDEVVRLFCFLKLINEMHEFEFLASKHSNTSGKLWLKM